MQDKKTTKKNTKRVAIVGGTVAALMGGGIAFAAWTSTGSGTGTATAGSDAQLSIASATFTSLLYPNGSVGMKVTVSNPNPFPVHVDSIDRTSAAVTATGTCNASSVTAQSFTAPAGTGIDSAPLDKNDIGNVVAAGTTTAPGMATFIVPVSMDNTANDACKSATFTIPLSVSAHSVSN